MLGYLIRITYHVILNRVNMIATFKNKESEKLWLGESSCKYPPEIQQRALRKLRQLDAAMTMEDLKNPPGNQLEQLEGNRKGFMSIRINKQWRLCFEFTNGKAFEVHIVDYHK